MKTDLATLHRIWSETDRRLDSLSKQVREGVNVDEASNFCRWLQFSGVLKFLEPFEQDVPLPIRARELRRKCEVLISECGDWYRYHERSNCPRDAYISRSKLESIESRLSKIEEALSLPSRATADSGNSAEPGLFVMQAG
jgi:hypothetical protein